MNKELAFKIAEDIRNNGGRAFEVGGSVRDNFLKIRRENDDIDIDAKKIISGEESVEAVSDRIIDRLVKVSNGEQTSVEGVGYSYATFYQKDRRLEHYTNNKKPNCNM